MFNMSQKFDPAYKLQICQTVESGTSTVVELSRETGICENTLYGWMKRYRENRSKPFVGSGRILPENEEMVRLRRENKDLREEVEILKKAAAYFARNQR
jgi:transposase